MMQYYNFTRLINKYKCSFTLLTHATGQYNAKGDWVKGNSNSVTMQGAIISFKESKLFRSEGTLTANDKRLFMLEPIPNALKDSNVIYNNKKYSIEDCSDNAIFTGIYAYTLRFVSAFKEATT